MSAARGLEPRADSFGVCSVCAVCVVWPWVRVSCEHHDDKGGYHETSVKLGFNYRESFNTYVIRLRKDSLTWLVGHGKEPHIELKRLHHASATLSEPMTTRLILRTNFRDGDPGFMPDTAFEVSHFKFTPA